MRMVGGVVVGVAQTVHVSEIRLERVPRLADIVYHAQEPCPVRRAERTRERGGPFRHVRRVRVERLPGILRTPHKAMRKDIHRKHSLPIPQLWE